MNLSSYIHADDSWYETETTNNNSTSKSRAEEQQCRCPLIELEDFAADGETKEEEPLNIRYYKENKSKTPQACYNHAWYLQNVI